MTTELCHGVVELAEVVESLDESLSQRSEQGITFRYLKTNWRFEEELARNLV